MNDASSESRKATTAAISSAVPKRPSGVRSSICFIIGCWANSARPIGVSIRPGASEFTRPPRLSWATPAHLYFRYVLPRIGSLLAGDKELHEYLTESAATFLSAPELSQAVQKAGFALRSHSSHLDGLVTIVAATAK